MANAEAGELSSKWHFHPIISARAHEEVVSQIAFSILSGAFRPDDRLPNIDALARFMGVSKPVVGEALKVLSAAGVVKTQRGINGGLTVTTNNVPDTILAMTAPLRHLGVREILEARKPIEVQLCLLASARASAEDFDAMQVCIDMLRQNRNSDLALRIRFDHLFHYTIGRTANSGALALYQHQILEHLFIRMRDYFADIENVDEVVEVHHLTLEAIKGRDPAVIRRTVNIHLLPLEEAVKHMGNSEGQDSSSSTLSLS